MNRATYLKLISQGIPVLAASNGLEKQARREEKRAFWAVRLAQQRKPDGEKIADARRRRARMREARSAVQVDW